MVTRTCPSSNGSPATQAAKRSGKTTVKLAPIGADGIIGDEGLLGRAGNDILRHHGGSLVLRNGDETPKRDQDGVKIVAPDLSGSTCGLAYRYAEPQRDSALTAFMSDILKHEGTPT